MTLTIKSQYKACVAIAMAAMALFPAVSLAKSRPITPVNLLETLLPGEPWDRGVLSSTKTVMFQQAASGGTDSTTIAKITMSYFTLANCSGSVAGSGSYTTPNGTSFTISVGKPFGLVAASTWNVGSTKLSIADMTTIQSVAVTLKSTNNNTPQANFSGVSFACVPVTCTAGPSGQCTSASVTQSFQLKTTAAIGDPADGGVIACMNGGLNNLVIPTANNSESIQWNPNLTLLGITAQSITNGAANTTTIVNCYSNNSCPAGVIVPTQISTNTYAAGICSTYTATGGYTSGWFLPAGNNTTPSGQLQCLKTNRLANGMPVSNYWSSTEANFSNAWFFNFNSTQFTASKTNTARVRCVRNFTP